MDEFAVDGNALAAPLLHIFGIELTTALVTCATCGTTAHVAELIVFNRAPGTIARCRCCDAALIVFVTRSRTTCLDLTGLSALEPAQTPPNG